MDRRSPTGARTALLLAALAAVPPAPRPVPGACLEVVYEGTLEHEGHYRRPGERRSYASRQRYLADGQGTVRLDWTTGDVGDPEPSTESFLVQSGAIYHRAGADRPWRALGGRAADSARLQALAGLPWELARGPRFRTVGSRRLAAAIGERTRTIAVERSPRRVLEVVDAWPHPRLGDVADRAVYRYGTGPVSERMELSLYERDSDWSLKQGRVSFRADAPDTALLEAPAEFEAARGDPPPGEPTLVPVGAGLWAVETEDLDARSLLVEFADHLVLIEAAVGSANGERLVDLARRRWPTQPIRSFLFSHYHPHYAGGLRALVAEGATIVTTAGNADFVRDRAARRFERAPDRLARAPRALSLRTFEGRVELADASQRLVAVDIGARSDHTDEFLIFWFPEQRVVFEAEQGWLSVDGEVKASRRAQRFLQTLAEEGLAAERIVQSWPMRGTARELSRQELETLVGQRGD